MTFTHKQLNDWRAFEEIRDEGRYNMMSPQVAHILGISREDHLFIIKNYSALKAAYEAEEDLYYENQAKYQQGNDDYGYLPV